MKDIIQQTAWPLKEEILSRAQTLGMATFNDTKFTYQELSTQLYVSQQSAWAQEFLENLFIGSIYSLYGHYDVSDSYSNYSLIIDLSMVNFAEKSLPIIPGSNHYTIPIEDTGNNFPELLEHLNSGNLFEKINAARDSGQRVLINCHMGVSRSATVAILYMMSTYGVSLIQAYHHLQKFRPVVEPNPGYFSALLNHENSLVVEPPLFPNVKPWLEEFISHNSVEAFNITLHENKVILEKKSDASELGSSFIQLISFLKMLNIPFTPISLSLANGKIQLSSEHYENFLTVLTNKGAEKDHFRLFKQTNKSNGQQSDPQPLILT